MDAGLTVVDPFAAMVDRAIHALPTPLWAPWPLPPEWRFAGLVHGRVFGGSASGTTSCWAGTDPFGDPIEALFVCEEAGAGLGGLFAGLPTHYPTPDVGVGPPHIRLHLQGRSIPLWKADAIHDRAVYVGEAAGRWLWVVVHPGEGSAFAVSPLTIVDARELGAELAVLPLAELSPRLLVEVPPGL
jgi:hypothetical protein